MARQSKIEVVPSLDGKHFIRVRAANGEVVVVSEGYDSQGNAKKAAKRLKRVVANAVVVEATE